jgi:Ner family transcriptional regulator
MDANKLAPQAGWNRFDIVAAINKRGLTLPAFAEEHGLSTGSVSKSLNQPFPKCDREIARFLKVPLHQLWPSRYDEHGERIGILRRRRKPTEPHNQDQTKTAA